MCNKNPPGCDSKGYHHEVSKETFIPILGTKDISDHFYSHLKYGKNYTGYMVDKNDKKIERAGINLDVKKRDTATSDEILIKIYSMKNCVFTLSEISFDVAVS